MAEGFYQEAIKASLRYSQNDSRAHSVQINSRRYKEFPTNFIRTNYVHKIITNWRGFQKSQKKKNSNLPENDTSATTKCVMCPRDMDSRGRWRVSLQGQGLLASKVPYKKGRSITPREKLGKRRKFAYKQRTDCEISRLTVSGLVLFIAIFFHNPLKLFLTGGNYSFSHIIGGKPNAALEKRGRLIR